MQNDSAYRQPVGNLYMQTGIQKLNQGKIQKAAPLFEAAANFHADVRMEIAQACFQKGKRTLNRHYFDLAVRMSPCYRTTIFNLLMDKAINASDKNCAPLYEMATIYCGKTCELIKQADERLTTIVDGIEKTNPLDKRIVAYRRIASKMFYVPPQIKIYDPGFYPFKLTKGELTCTTKCGYSNSTNRTSNSGNPVRPEKLT